MCYRDLISLNNLSRKKVRIFENQGSDLLRANIYYYEKKKSNEMIYLKNVCVQSEFTRRLD